MASHEQIFPDETEVVQESAMSSNDLIIENICRFMPFKDLLSSSLINRRWNYLSREELRKRRKCYAKISVDKPCQQLLQLNEVFESKTLPFNGLSLGGHCLDGNTCSVGLSRETSQILGKFPIKYLQLMLYRREKTFYCLATWLIKTLVKYRGSEIQELSIGNTGRSLWDPWCSRCRSRCSPFCDAAEYFGVTNTDWLPNVTTLEILCEQNHLVHQFAAAAPKLQKIRGNIRPVHLHELLNMKKAHLIEDFNLDSVCADNADALMQFAELGPKLVNLKANWQERQTEVWLSAFKILLDSSYLSLCKLEIEHFDLMLLGSEGQNCLLNLKHLTVGFNERLERHLEYFSLGKLNFDLIFPNFEYLEISESNCLHGYPEELIRMIPFEKLKNVQLNNSVRCVKISNNCFDIYTKTECMSLASTFPNVTSFEIENCRNVVSYLSCLWESWRHLEALRINTTVRPTQSTNLDAFFCGLSEEECGYLQSLEQNNPGMLSKLQLVSSSPSLTHLMSLKSLKIEIFHSYLCTAVRHPENRCLTSVSGYLAFGRMPDLNVEIIRKECKTHSDSPCCFGFNDLINFANVS